MSTPHPARWIGRWIALVGLLHLVVGFFIFKDAWAVVVDRGIVAGVSDFDSTATAFWFAALGPAMMIVGGLVDHFEKVGDRPPSWLGWAMTALLVALIVPMPETGAWLWVPPTIALLVRSQRLRPTPD